MSRICMVILLTINDNHIVVIYITGSHIHTNLITNHHYIIDYNELNNHNYAIRRSYFYIRKIIQVIMKSYSNSHICNFERTWEISNKTRNKRQSHNQKTQYYYQRRSNVFQSSIQDQSLYLWSFMYTLPLHIQVKIHITIYHINCIKNTDSFRIEVGNRTNYTMTPSVHDFISPIIPVHNLYVQGIGGRLLVTRKGTVSWTIKDDQGVQHDIFIPNTIYV